MPTEVLDEDNVTRMASQFTSFLQGIVADPNQRIAELPLLTGKERHHLLAGFEQQPGGLPAMIACFHQLLEAQVERTPDAVAVVFENEQITYQELNDQGQPVSTLS